MKAVILAGGLGTRRAEETTLRPRPMVEIGGRPILWRMMKIILSCGIDDFIIYLGRKGYMVDQLPAGPHGDPRRAIDNLRDKHHPGMLRSNGPAPRKMW